MATAPARSCWIPSQDGDVALFAIATLVGGELVWVDVSAARDVRFGTRDDGTAYGWGCADLVARTDGRELYTVEHRPPLGKITAARRVFTLADARLEQVDLDTESWGDEDTVPAGWEAEIRCGELRTG